MKQERLKGALEWVDRLIARTKAAETHSDKVGDNRTYITAVYMLRRYKPLRYSLQKAIEKPVRTQGNRAFCPDCGTGVKKKDNYCRICGQRLAAQEKKEPYYLKFDKRKYYGR